MKLQCFVAADVNIDLKQCQTHQDTKTYLDSLIVNNFLPVIVMPTRITDRTATLIDHIYYSDVTKCVDDVITGGNLWCDITDHLPNFVLLESTKDRKHKINNPSYTRVYFLKV